MCQTSFNSRRARIYHEKHSKSCGGKAPGPPKRPRLARETPSGEAVTVLNVTGMEEEVTVELLVEPDKEESLQCPYCLHTYSTVSNRRKHDCVLEPSLNPTEVRLKLLDGQNAETFREDHARPDLPHLFLARHRHRGTAPPNLSWWACSGPGNAHARAHC